MQSDEQQRALPSILIVEDDKQASDLLGVIIRRRYPGVTIYSAENGRIGVQLFKEHVPDIVITDINMPEMSGIEMAREIKTLRSSTKIVVVTAFSTTTYLETFREIGFTDYLLKPIEFTKLFAALEKCMEETNPERQRDNA